MFIFCCFLYYSYAGDSDFELSVKGVSVGIEDLQVQNSVVMKINAIVVISFKFPIFELTVLVIEIYLAAALPGFLFVVYRYVETCVLSCGLSFLLLLLWAESLSSSLTDL